MNFLEQLFEDPLESFLIFVLLTVALFIIFREIFCWYWKINERLAAQNREYIALQEIIDNQNCEIDLLKTIIAKMDQGNTGNTIALDEVASTSESEAE